MRRIRGDFRIASCRLEPAFGERRRVVEMDQVMRHARMLRLTRPDLFKNSRTFQLIGIGLVRRRRPDIERQRIVDLRFIVIRISSCELLHRLEIIQHAGAMIDLVVIGIHCGERFDVVALALGLGADRLAFRERGSTLREVLGGRGNVWIPQQA